MDDFITAVSSELERQGYLTEPSPTVPGVQALLYAHFPGRVRLGFSKVEDHFLFVDWENTAFGRLDQLLEFYERFSRYANRGFSTPHALRMQIPNLGLVAISPTGFPEEVLRFAHHKNLNPWFGGETGQLILVDLNRRQITHWEDARQYRRYPAPGALPLDHTAEVIGKACREAFRIRE